jgi:DNA-binding response OmpR family regulator
MPRTSGDELLAEIGTRDYDCRVAIVTAVEPDFDIIEMGFDEYLVKPVDREEMGAVVSSLVTRSEYDEKLQRLFSLASKRAALQAEKTPEELGRSDAYAELSAEFERLRSELERTAEELSDRDFEVEMRRVSAEP